MNFLVLSGNVKQDGLCHRITESVAAGAKDGGANVVTRTLSGFLPCRVCGEGWGICRAEHRCIFGEQDEFAALQEEVKRADAFCLITPVYWGEPAETLKGVLDKLRRCEFGQAGSLSGKQVLLVASAGGSGNGIVPCLEHLDRFCRHTGGIIFDYIAVNRWNQDYKQQAAFAAAKTMALDPHT